MFATYACNTEKEVPVKRVENNEYIPSKDSNNVFRHILMGPYETFDAVFFDKMRMVDSLYKIGVYKNFKDMNIIMYNKNKSLDSIINVYSNKYGIPIFYGKLPFGSDNPNIKEILLNYNYNSKYYLEIRVFWKASTKYKTFNKIKTKQIRYFSWFPYLRSYKIRTNYIKIGKYDREQQYDVLNNAQAKALDSMYRILNPVRKK